MGAKRSFRNRRKRNYQTRKGAIDRARESAARQLRRRVAENSITVTHAWIRINNVQIDPDFGWRKDVFLQLGFELMVRRYRMYHPWRSGYVRRRVGIKGVFLKNRYLDLELEKLIEQKTKGIV